MIDGVKISFYSETIVKDLSCLGVAVLTPTEEETGEIHFPKYGVYRALRFKIRESNRVEINGSLHKYWKGENHSNFTFGELCECISDLCGKFDINPLEARLHNLEFGVNVSPPFNPYEFCGNVIAFRGESFSKFRTNGKDKIQIGFEATKNQYSVKVYDKGKQYRKSENILRYEIRVNKMERIKYTGIYFLSDLTDRNKLEALGLILNEVFDELIICDKVNPSDLSKNEFRIYTEGKNPKEWEQYTPKQRTTRKKQFNEIIGRHGQNNWKETTARMVNEKWRMLLSLNSKTGYVLTDLTKVHRECFDRLDNTSNHTLPVFTEKRFCKSCGRDISAQKKGSVFCSESIFGREAKKCRNKDSNPRKVIRYREQRLYGGLNLFDIKPLLSKIE